MGTIEWKLPRGVSIRNHRNGESLQLFFMYKGVRCREPLPLVINKKNIKYAGNLLGEIKNNIERDTFDYAAYFPKSAKLKIFGSAHGGLTVLSYLNDYLAQCEKRGLSHTTIDGYKKSKNALSSMHDIRITELLPRDILAFIENATTTTKTIRNRLSVLRSAIDKATTQGIIKHNPVDAVQISLYAQKDIKVDARQNYDEVDQFSQAEVNAFLGKCVDDELNIVEFCIATGVRSSEWAGLKWEDIDFVQNQAHIVEVFTLGKTKQTKTKAGRRFIPLDKMAMAALARQKALTFLHSEYVFLNKAGKPWNVESFRKNRWVRILKRAGVRYRKPYQLRHTFATRHISQGENLWKLAKWMGHSSPEMLFRHYGNFIEDYEKIESKKSAKVHV